MALVGRLKDEHSQEYLLQIDELTIQFKSSFLKRNTNKTKELMFGGVRTTQPSKPIFIDNQEVEIVKSFKYLGTLLDESLSFCEHVDYVYKKAQQRLFLLRKLNSFDVSQHILQLVYRSLIASVLSFNIITWYGHVHMVFIYILNLFTLHILVLISITTIIMCPINRIYYGSPILLLSFYCVTEEQYPFLM